MSMTSLGEESTLQLIDLHDFFGPSDIADNRLDTQTVLIALDYIADYVTDLELLNLLGQAARIGTCHWIIGLGTDFLPIIGRTYATPILGTPVPGVSVYSVEYGARSKEVTMSLKIDWFISEDTAKAIQALPSWWSFLSLETELSALKTAIENKLTL